MSHPTRVRGLKLRIAKHRANVVKRSHPTRVRGLKLSEWDAKNYGF